MKTSNLESESAQSALYDFIYLDRARIASYHAQLTNLGTLTGLTINEDTSETTTRSGNLGFPKVFGGDMAVGKTTQDGSQKQYDPALIVAIDTIERLDDEGSVSSECQTAALGSAVIAHGTLAILDARLIQELWEPVAALLQLQATTPQEESPPQLSRQQRRYAARSSQSDSAQASTSTQPAVAEIARKLPHTVQALLDSDDGSQLWGVLEPESVIGSPNTLALKHGANISGEWSVFALLDGRPDIEVVDPASIDVSNITGVIRFLQQFVRHHFGRPTNAYAITPLAIYRPVPRALSSADSAIST